MGSSRDVRTAQGSPGKPLGHPRKPTSQEPALASLGRPDGPGASPGFLGVSYACPNVPRPTLTSHHITKPIGLCWPKYLNEVTTCHLQERTNSFYSLVSARSRLPRAGHSSWLHGRAKSRAVDEAVFVGRSPHMPFLSCRGFAFSPGTGRDTRDPKTVKTFAEVISCISRSNDDVAEGTKLTTNIGMDKANTIGYPPQNATELFVFQTV